MKLFFKTTLLLGAAATMLLSMQAACGDGGIEEQQKTILPDMRIFHVATQDGRILDMGLFKEMPYLCRTGAQSTAVCNTYFDADLSSKIRYQTDPGEDGYPADYGDYDPNSADYEDYYGSGDDDDGGSSGGGGMDPSSFIPSGGGGPHYTADPGVSTRFGSGDGGGVSSGQSIDFHGATDFSGAPGSTSVTFGAGVGGGGCDVASVMCDFSALIIDMLSSMGESEAHHFSRSECIAGFNASIASEPELQQAVSDPAFCQFIAALQCILPKLRSLMNSGFEVEDEEAFARELQACGFPIVTSGGSDHVD